MGEEDRACAIFDSVNEVRRFPNAAIWNRRICRGHFEWSDVENTKRHRLRTWVELTAHAQTLSGVHHILEPNCLAETHECSVGRGLGHSGERATVSGNDIRVWRGSLTRPRPTATDGVVRLNTLFKRGEEDEGLEC